MTDSRGKHQGSFAELVGAFQGLLLVPIVGAGALTGSAMVLALLHDEAPVMIAALGLSQACLAIAIGVAVVRGRRERARALQAVAPREDLDRFVAEVHHVKSQLVDKNAMHEALRRRVEDVTAQVRDVDAAAAVDRERIDALTGRLVAQDRLSGEVREIEGMAHELGQRADALSAELAEALAVARHTREMLLKGREELLRSEAQLELIKELLLKPEAG